MCTLLDPLIKVDGPLTGHIICNQGLLQPMSVVAKCLANGIINVDLPTGDEVRVRGLENVTLISLLSESQQLSGEQSIHGKCMHMHQHQ
jgi:hypothetical protein